MTDNTDWGPRHAEIALRAYAIWELEGRPDGRDVEHWLRAKAELEADARAQAYVEADARAQAYVEADARARAGLTDPA